MKFLYYSASWCQPCRILGPTMSEISQQIPVEKVDVDTNTSLTMKYGVRGIPTVILVDSDGKELARTVGVQPKEHYIDQYKQYTKNL